MLANPTRRSIVCTTHGQVRLVVAFDTFVLTHFGFTSTASAYQVLMMASWTCNVVLYSTVFDVGGPMMLIYST